MVGVVWIGGWKFRAKKKKEGMRGEKKKRSCLRKKKEGEAGVYHKITINVKPESL